MTFDYDNLRDAIRRIWPDTVLETLSEEGLSAIRREHVGIPEHYPAFLRHIGWGSFGPGVFMVYNGPIYAEEIFGPAPTLSGVWLIGDDFAGWCLGLDSRDGWGMVGVESPDRAPYSLASHDIVAFITERLATEADG